MRFWSPVLAGLLLFIVLSAPVFAQEDTLAIHDYINDYAGILDEQTERDLNEAGRDFASRTGSQIVVVTTDSLHGADAMKTATDLGNDYGVGHEKLDNGVVILVSIDDKQRFMATGSGIQGTLTDIATEHLQQKYLVPAFREGDYAKGIRDLYYGTIDAIENGIDEGELEAYAQDDDDPVWILGLVFGTFGVVGAILAIVFLSLARRKIILHPGERFTLHHPGWNFMDPDTTATSNHPDIVDVADGVLYARTLGKARITLENPVRGIRYVFVKVTDKPVSAANNEKYLNQFFLTQISINSDSDHDDGFFSGGGSGGGFSGGGGSFNGGGSGGSW